MKLLVIARRLHIDRSSEGICSSKFVLALARAGVDMVCLTRDDICARPTNPAPFAVSWLPGVRLLHTRALAGRPVLTQRAHARAARTAALSGAARKIDSALFYLSGHRFDGHRDIAIWQRAIGQLIDRERPDAIIVRGEGTAFDAHLALARMNPSTPWIAHYHDPYPSSRYPEPFRAVLPVASRAQERGHASILRRSHALTFPSARLMRWVLCGEFEPLRRKAFILPHLASELPQPAAAAPTRRIAPDTFTLVHTGALLGPRSPAGLIEGFRRFVGSDPARLRQARLLLIGPMHRSHAAAGARETLAEGGHVECVDERVSYHTSLSLARQAAVNVVIEATGATSSPFLPAKFADYVAVGRPILALSLRESSVADAIGADSPLLVSPDDPAAVAIAVERLWREWQAGTLSRSAPPAALRHALSESVMLDELERALDFVGTKVRFGHRSGPVHREPQHVV